MPVGLHTLLGYARPHWRIALLAAFGMLLEAGVAAAFTRLMRPILDDAFVARDPYFTSVLPFAILALFALRALGVYIGDYGAARISRSIVRDLRERCFAHYLVLPSSYFHSHATGQLVSRLTVEVEQLGQACTEGFKVLTADGLMIIGLLSVMLYNSVQLTLTVLVAGPLIALIVGTVSKRYRALSRGIQGSLADVSSRTHAVISGERELKIYGAQANELARFRALNQQNFRQHLKVAQTNAISTSLVQFFAAGALALVIGVASRQHGAQAISAGTFMSFILAMLLILPSLKRLTTVQSLIGRGAAAAGSVEALLAEPGELDQGTLVVEQREARIELQGVSLRYPGAERDALQNIDLLMEPGTVTALVGRSGGGKTSLAALLPRLVEPTSGRILFNGHTLPQYRLSALRQQFALVGQQVVLSAETVASNVTYGQTQPAPAARIRAALEAAQAWSFVAPLKQGADTPVGENGALLSGGQRQRIALARALLKDAPVLILDEATSALDNESERAVQQALEQLQKGRTTLVIAHRLSTVESADQIVVLDGGCIVERGKHAQLLKAGGLYAQLYRQGLAA